MNVKTLIGTVVETVIKVVVLAAFVLFVLRGASQAYEFGYKVFADEPVSVAGGRTITVGIAESASVKEIAQMLEEKGLISDASLFVVQEMLSAYHGKILPGIYDLSTDMKAEQMLEIMSTPSEMTQKIETADESETIDETETANETGTADEAGMTDEADRTEE